MRIARVSALWGKLLFPAVGFSHNKKQDTRILRKIGYLSVNILTHLEVLAGLVQYPNLKPVLSVPQLNPVLKV